MVSKKELGLVFTILHLNRIRRMESFNYLLIPTAPHQTINKQAQTVPQLAVTNNYYWEESNMGGQQKKNRKVFVALIITKVISMT